VIDYYEKLFFHVRDRLSASDWILQVIKGPRRSYRDNASAEMTEANRGYVLRLFAYYGGPLVLDAAISGMVPKAMPQRAEDVRGWFDEVLCQLVKSNAAAAASALEMNQKNMIQMMKLAVNMNAAKAKQRGNAPQVYDDSYFEKVLAAIEPYPAPSLPGPSQA
jgi:hypothetical protein